MKVLPKPEENRKLEERAKAGEKGQVKNRLERAKLESQLQDVQRIFEQIPAEILQELKNEKKQEHKREF